MFSAAAASEFYPGGGHDRVDVIIAGDDACALVIADGMGGRSGAAPAAQMWIDAVRGGSQEPSHWTDSDYWLDLMAAADRAIRDEPEAGETTAVIAVLTPNGLCGASVGDSGAWMVMADRPLDLSESQTHKPGLGTGMAIPIPFYRKQPVSGTLLVATDGLLKYTSQQQICEIVRATREVDALPRMLIDLVRMPSGRLQDDVAVALARHAPASA